MRYKLFITIITTFCCLILLPACAKVDQRLDNKIYELDTSGGDVLGVPLNLSYDKINNLPVDVQTQSQNIEGDEYQTARIKVSPEIELYAIFDHNLKLYTIETNSEFVADKYSIKVGSTLKDVIKKWPNGSFIYGINHDKFARYLTGTEIVYSFNPNDIHASCFEIQKKCDNPIDLTVKGIIIYTEPVN